MEGPRLIHAECVAAMRKLPARSVDHVITDPPYSEKTHAKGKRLMRAKATQLQLGG